MSKASGPSKYKEFREYIKGVTLELKNLYLLNEWTMEWEFDEENSAGEVDHGEKYRSESAVAEIDIQVVYLTFKITFYKGMYEYWKENDYDGLLGALMHEFAHILIEPIDHIAEEHIPPHLRKHYSGVLEQQTERIKNVLMNLKISLMPQEEPRIEEISE